MLTFSLLAALASPPAGHTAVVNDPASHGTLGDALLSLDEAIRVGNGTLTLASLSAAERAQISGSGPDLAEIVIDAAITPLITLQAPLTAIVGAASNTGHIEVRGIAAAGIAPRLDGNGQVRVFTLQRHLVHLEGLHVDGGQVAVEAQMGPMGPVHHMALVHACKLEGQTTAGVVVRGRNDDESMLMIEHTHFETMPVGILVDDQNTSGMVMVECEHVHMDGVALGNDVLESGNGDMSSVIWWRCEFHNGQTLARARRGQFSTRQFMLRVVHSLVHCSGDVFDVQGNAVGLTIFHHHHSDFVAGAGAKALWLHPRTAQFDIHGSEVTFEGDVLVSGNPFTLRVWQQNNTYRNGTVTYDVDGALPNLLWNRFENCTLLVPASARSPVTVRSSEFHNTTVTGQAAFAPIALQGCFRNGGSISGHTTEQAPAPAAFLGTASVTPTDPAIGSTVRLVADLPFGIGAFWDFVFAYSRPTTTAEPFRLYGDPASAVILPGMVVFRSQTDVPLPNNAALVGIELYVQPVAVPIVGQGYAPVYHLPRGGRLQPRF
jgi:hypothetical protein